MKTSQASIVGIDVSKDKVDIYSQGQHRRFENHQMRQALSWLGQVKPDWIVLEPTGGYELPWVNALNQAGLRVARPHVTRMRYHARGKGLSKTDPLDAKALAHYGECYQEQLRPCQPDESQALLKALFQRRLQLVGMRTEEKNRYSHQELPLLIQESLAQNIVALDAQIHQVEEQLRKLVKQSCDNQRKMELMQSMPGVGETVALGLLALLPELGKQNRKPLGALVGVVPLEHSSGKKTGKASIGGGRFEVRSLLYMAALSASRFCPQISRFYQHLQNNGKSHKQARIACAHKMLRILNAMLKTNTPYQNT